MASTMLTIEESRTKKIGTITAVSIPSEFQFQVNSDAEKPLLQDFVVVEHPKDPSLPVLGKIVRLSRFNPLLPEEATLELSKLRIDESFTPLPLFGRMEMVAAACQVLGTPDQFGHLRNPGFPAKPGTSVYLPTPEFMRKVLSGRDLKDDLLVGTLRNRADIAVTVNANEILNKHVAILAMTGAGKTYVASVLLEELLKKGYPILVVDPHADYISLGTTVEANAPFEFNLGKGISGKYKLTVLDRSIDITELDKEEFLDLVQGLSEEEISPAQRGKYGEAYDHAKKSGKRGLSGIYDFLNEEGESKTVGAMYRQLAGVRSMLKDVDTSLTFSDVERCLGPGRGVVLNMSLLPAQVQRINVHIVLQKLFEKRKNAVLSGKQQFPPVFVVIEEAHNFAPAFVEEETYPSRAIIRRIATEGRKFGFGLCVLSQRPSRLDATVLSQCNSQIILKIVNPNDQNYIRQTVESLAVSDLYALPELSQGEALASGAMVPVPTLVKVRRRESSEGMPARDRLEEIAEFFRKQR